MVKPMITGDRPTLSAIEAAPATNRSALQISMMNPTKMAAAAISMYGNFLLKYAFAARLNRST